MAGKSIRGTVQCRMSGGPLDGAVYGDLPSVEGAPSGARLRIPLNQPADEAPCAVYICNSAPERTDVVWTFHYVKTEYPGLPVGTQVTFK